MNYGEFFTASLPITIVSTLALVLMLASALVKNSTRLCTAISLAGLAAAIAAAVLGMNPAGTGFGGMIQTGGTAHIYDIVFCSAGILTVILAREYLSRTGGMFNEFYTLLVMAIAGMMLMAHANDFIILFVGVEVMSIAFYVLAGLQRGRLASNESALKYFLLGAFASGFLLYGIALVYGSTGSTSYTAITQALFTGVKGPLGLAETLFLPGVGLLMVGLGFKIAAFPFHQWAPDVYEGAPTVVSGFMSTAGKAAAFSGFVGFMTPVLAAAGTSVGSSRLRLVLSILAVGSMLVGNITAIVQSNIKRMLAYSSIAHAGYMLIGLVSGNRTGYEGIVYYLIAYLFMQLGAFAIVGILERDNGGQLGIADYNGLGRRRPGLAGVMAVFMFSLTGLPPFAGFFGKYTLFKSAVESGYTWLAVVGVVASTISAWFYLGLIIAMYFREPEDGKAEGTSLSMGSRAVLGLTLLGSLVIGFIPGYLLSVVR